MTSASLLDCVICSAPLVISALLFLILARVCLWRRAEAGDLHFFESLFSRADRWLQGLNRNPMTRGLAFGFGDRSLPAKDPVAWRETRRQFVGPTERLGRLVLFLEILLAVWLIWQALLHPAEISSSLSNAWIMLWFLGCLTMVVVSTGVMPGERSQQTMDVLLATPMTAAEIVLQKLSGVRRIVVVLCFPLLTILAFQLCWIWFMIDGAGRFNSAIGYVSQINPDLLLVCLGRALAVPTYLSLIGWLGFQAGLRMKNQLQAVLGTLGILLIACLFPTLIRISIDSLRPYVPTGQRVILDTFYVFCDWINPCWILFQNGRDVGNLLPWFLNSDILPAIWFPLLFHFSLVVGMLWRVRRNALRQFSRFVNRMEPDTARHLPLKINEQAPLLEFDTAVGPASGGNDFVEG